MEQPEETKTVDPTPMSAPLILCVGHRYRRDDGVGPWVGDRLRERGLTVVELSGEGIGVIEAIAGQPAVVLVDATQSGAPPGTVHRIDAVASPLPSGWFRYSTHLFGVAEAVETARALHRLPGRLIIYGIEGAQFEFGEGLTPEVESAAAAVVTVLADPAGSWLDSPS